MALRARGEDKGGGAGQKARQGSAQKTREQCGKRAQAQDARAEDKGTGTRRESRRKGHGRRTKTRAQGRRKGAGIFTEIDYAAFGGEGGRWLGPLYSDLQEPGDA